MKGLNKFQMVMLSGIMIIAITWISSVYATVPYSPEPDFYLNATANWTAGTEVNVSDYDDRFNITDNTLELDAPHLRKSDYLVGYWRFENNADDETGFNDGVLTDAPTYVANGKIDGAYDFEESATNYITVAQSDTLNSTATGDMTISIWVKPESYDELYMMFVSRRTNGANDYTAPFVLSTDGSFRPRFALGEGSSSCTATSTEALTFGKWYHIVGTISGTSAKIYVNGVLRGSDTFSGTRQSGNRPMLFGYYGTTYYLDGIMDEIQLYNTSLSQNEINDLYLYGYQKYVASPEIIFNSTEKLIPNEKSGSNWFMVNDTIRLGFYDDFDDGTVDYQRWFYGQQSSSTYTEADGFIKLATTVSYTPYIRTYNSYFEPYNWSVSTNYTNSSTSRYGYAGMFKYGSNNPSVSNDAISISGYVASTSTITYRTYEGSGSAIDSDIQNYLEVTDKNFQNMTGVRNTSGYTDFYVNGTLVDNDHTYAYNLPTQGEVALVYSGTIWADYFYINSSWANVTNKQSIPYGMKVKNYTITYSGADSDYYINNITFRNSDGTAVAYNLTDITSGTSVTYSDANGMDYGSLGYANDTNDEIYIEIFLAGAGKQDVLLISDMYGYFENYNVTPSFTSAPINITSGQRLKNTTISYINVDSSNYIDKVEWLDGYNNVRATNETNIVSGTSITYYSTALSSGSFNYLNSTGNMSIRVYLAGSGTDTPTIQDIYGYYESSSSGGLSWNFQLPSDIGVFTFFSTTQGNISYNYTGDNTVDNTTFRYYSKVNSSLDDTFYNIQGAIYSGWQTNFTHELYNSTSDAKSWNITLYDNTVYPASYNYDPELMEYATHYNYTLDNPNKYLKVRWTHAYTTKNFTFFEVMAYNNTAIPSPMRFYYCNSSYTTGIVTNNINCGQFYSLEGVTGFNHSHLPYSYHQIIPMAFNITTGLLSGVKVTSDGYILMRAGTVGSWNVSYIHPAGIDAGYFKYSSNNGNSWSSLGVGDYYPDAHVHQYYGDETYCYYAELDDTVGNTYEADERCDLLEIGGMYPTSPNVYHPNNATHYGNISINWTASFSANGYEISYNVSLFYPNFTLYSFLYNATSNLSYYFDPALIPYGSYIVGVNACDTLGQCTYGYSPIFTYSDHDDNIAILSIICVMISGILLYIIRKMDDYSLLRILLFAMTLVFIIVALFTNVVLAGIEGWTDLVNMMTMSMNLVIFVFVIVMMFVMINFMKDTTNTWRKNNE